MPRVEFLEDFDFKPVPQQTYSYKKGNVVLVKQEIADKAIANKKAKLTDLPTIPSAGIKETIKKFSSHKKKEILTELIVVPEDTPTLSID